MTLQDKQHPETPPNLFSVDHLLLLDMKPNLKSSLFSPETPLEEAKLSFSSGYQLELVSGLGWGMCPLLNLGLGPICYKSMHAGRVQAASFSDVLIPNWMLAHTFQIPIHNHCQTQGNASQTQITS